MNHLPQSVKLEEVLALAAPLNAARTALDTLSSESQSSPPSPSDVSGQSVSPPCCQSNETVPERDFCTASTTQIDLICGIEGPDSRRATGDPTMKINGSTVLDKLCAMGLTDQQKALVLDRMRRDRHENISDAQSKTYGSGSVSPAALYMRFKRLKDKYPELEEMFPSKIRSLK